MEAEKLQKKKLSKGKLKKTIKNVLCRPDPVFWPTVSEEHEKVLQTLLSKYKVFIPEIKKPHWNELKSIPKEQRPKPMKIEKPSGILFGISESKESISKSECSAVLIEAAVNPKTIVQSVIEACTNNRVPVVFLNGLRKMSVSYFGIPTSCLGIKQGSLTDLSEKIFELVKDRLPKEETKDVEMCDSEAHKGKQAEKMETQECLYLYRQNKKSRVFVPPSAEISSVTTKQFAGQDFIEFTDKNNPKKAFMKMMVKRVSNNPERQKKKEQKLVNR